MMNLGRFYRAITSTSLLLILLFAQQICNIESIVHDYIPHSHEQTSNSEPKCHHHSDNQIGHNGHEVADSEHHGVAHAHGDGHSHNNSGGTEDNCCKKASIALLTGSSNYSQLKADVSLAVLTFHNVLRASIGQVFAALEYVKLFSQAQQLLRSQLLSSLSLSPNAPPR